MKIAVKAEEEYEIGGKAVQLCDEDFEINAVLKEKETGKKWLLLRLPNSDVERKVSCAPQAVVKALISLGVSVRQKELTRYLQEEIFRQKRYLQIVEIDVGDADYDSYYEDFIRFVWEHEHEMQDENNLTKIVYHKEGNKATVTLDAKILRRDFFKKIGVSDEYEQTEILRYWRERGWLLNQNSRKDALTVMAGYKTSRGRRLTKSYKIVVPMENGYVEGEKPVLQVASQQV
ncbi:MAG: hypothetical protein QMD10_10190 [Desulfitobacteriaceae bacterium]|nr:hypothetical protein [Desulfitobacteriaceae bacterium]